MTCNCNFCIYGRQVKQHLDNLGKSDREFFEDMYERLVCTQTDRDVNQAVINGTWPSARQQLAVNWPELREEA